MTKKRAKDAAQSCERCGRRTTGRRWPSPYGKVGICCVGKGPPSSPETPAPVHYLARFAAGSFIACDPTIKDGWTPDPLAVTCEECRKVIRWRCGQAPDPETPAREGGVVGGRL